jgi:hypothetical protein
LVWQRFKHQTGSPSRWLLPRWERVLAWAVPLEDLQRAEAGEALVLLAGMKPVRGRSLITDRASAQFIDAASVARVAHDWGAAARPRAANAAAALSAPPSEKGKCRDRSAAADWELEAAARFSAPCGA